MRKPCGRASVFFARERRGVGHEEIHAVGRGTERWLMPAHGDDLRVGEVHGPDAVGLCQRLRPRGEVRVAGALQPRAQHVAKRAGGRVEGGGRRHFNRR